MQRLLLVPFVLTLCLAAGFSPALGATHDQPNPVVPVRLSSTPTTPLTEEMITLDTAFRDIVSAVALGDTAKVQAALQTVHGTMEKTHAGMVAGTVTLPKNASRTKEFIEKDRKFHERLEALERAAHRNNQREMMRITKQLLDGCVQCHQTFRK
jgi:cytochrome c556